MAKKKTKKIHNQEAVPSNWRSPLDCNGCPALDTEKSYCYMSAAFLGKSGKGLNIKKLSECPMNKLISEYYNAG